jgi:hypothetical protein
LGFLDTFDDPDIMSAILGIPNIGLSKKDYQNQIVNASAGWPQGSAPPQGSLPSMATGTGAQPPPIGGASPGTAPYPGPSGPQPGQSGIDNPARPGIWTAPGQPPILPPPSQNGPYAPPNPTPLPPNQQGPPAPIPIQNQMPAPAPQTWPDQSWVPPPRLAPPTTVGSPAGAQNGAQAMTYGAPQRIDPRTNLPVGQAPNGQLQAVPAGLPPAATAPPPTQSQRGGLAGALGIEPNGRWGKAISNFTSPDNVRSMLAGVGKGMSTIQGNTGGGAFARGFGGAITGGMAATEEQEKQKREEKKQSWDELNDAFKAVEAARRGDGLLSEQAAMTLLRQKQIQNLTVNGAGDSEQARALKIEQRVQLEREGKRKEMEADWNQQAKTVPYSEEQRDAHRKKLDDDTDKRRQELLGLGKINPARASADGSKEHPFDARGLTPEQFHVAVPIDSYFTDQNGKTRQRAMTLDQWRALQDRKTATPADQAAAAQ